MQRNRFAYYAWGTLGYNILVILWGAVVRATGSGAGCGSHWPLCNGEVVPRAPTTEMIIEFSHRLTSGLALISTVVLLIWAYRRYEKGHIVRAAALASMLFMITEALVGAGLVLLEYVAFNESVARAYWMAAHLINTFLLLATLTLTAWWASGNPGWQWRHQGIVRSLLLVAAVALLILGSSGAITALGDTLALRGGIDPSQSLFVATLVELRIYHPLLAFVVGAIVAAAVWVAASQRPTPQTWWLSRGLLGIFVVQLLVGAVNVALKAPVTMQIIHLLLADLLWILFILFSAATLSTAAYPRVTPRVMERVSVGND
ncbi:MAG: COX15/CtaA family protein [Caldilineaceae bacterium]|nr:COX15/CtaA family protein [Caldilineaceae bacterium]MCB0106243.1 COX15/CtaA family protein [Caldilineaceae bacterium]